MDFRIADTFTGGLALVLASSEGFIELEPEVSLEQLSVKVISHLGIM
jgi:hypothetical protein